MSETTHDLLEALSPDLRERLKRMRGKAMPPMTTPDGRPILKDAAGRDVTTPPLPTVAQWQGRIRDAGLPQCQQPRNRWTERQAAVFQACEGHAGHMIFHGKAGTGKTMLALALLEARFLTGTGVTLIRYSDFRESLLPRSLDRAGLTEADVIRRLVGAKWLLLDELGGGNPAKAQVSDHEIKNLMDLLSRKEAQEGSVILTMNLSLGRFAELYGEPVASRLLRAGYSKDFTFDAEPDHRVSQ